MAEKEELILVDEFDNQIGTQEKLLAHQEGNLHRAFSIFVYDKDRNILLQRRALTKYHSAGLWTNTCCSHQRPGEKTEEAAHRRLKEEMGFDTALEEIFSLTYRHEFENGLIQNEYDHILIGLYNSKVNPNEEEVAEYACLSQEKLKEMVEGRMES